MADVTVPLRVAETLTEVFVVTEVVLTVNVAVVAPAATVTFAGSDATALLSDNVTTVPLAGAGPLKVTVPVDDDPPCTVEGLSESEVRDGRLTVKLADLVVPLRRAEMLTVVLADTGIVLTVKVAVVAPAATVTLAGTVAAAVLLLVRVTTAPLHQRVLHHSELPWQLRRSPQLRSMG
jgi:hypothetical protein